jgi:hypothetical protein
MKEIKSCLTTCGKKIRIYDVHFQYSDCRFATYWVATLEQDNYYDDNDNGFLIDGKRLCFRSERNVFYDIDMLTNGLEWLQDLRKRAEPDESIKYRARVKPEWWMPQPHKLMRASTNMQEGKPHESGQTPPLSKVYDLWQQGIVSFEVLAEEFNQAVLSFVQPTHSDQMEPSRFISIDRLRSLVNEYASSDLSIHGPGAPLLPEYDFVDFVEKTLRADLVGSKNNK